MQGTLSIVGAGRVGRALGRRLRERGWKIGAVVTRSMASSRRAVRAIGGGQARTAIFTDVWLARIILITTPDSAVAQVAADLARAAGPELRGKVVLHTSGALDSRVLSPLKAAGAAVGTMHPLQSFSGVGVPPLEGKVFAIEGDATAVRAARSLIRSLDGLPVQISSSSKPRYHAAATMAAGHVLAVMEAAVRLLMDIGMKRREATRALMPLTNQVLANFERLGPRLAWTGPLSRGDYDVIASHLTALHEFRPEYEDAYDSLNRLGAHVLASDAGAVQAELDRIYSKRTKSKATGGQG